MSGGAASILESPVMELKERLESAPPTTPVQMGKLRRGKEVAQVLVKGGATWGPQSREGLPGQVTERCCRLPAQHLHGLLVVLPLPRKVFKSHLGTKLPEKQV